MNIKNTFLELAPWLGNWALRRDLCTPQRKPLSFQSCQGLAGAEVSPLLFSRTEGGRWWGLCWLLWLLSSPDGALGWLQKGSVEEVGFAALGLQFRVESEPGWKGGGMGRVKQTQENKQTEGKAGNTQSEPWMKTPSPLPQAQPPSSMI